MLRVCRNAMHIDTAATTALARENGMLSSKDSRRFQQHRTDDEKLRSDIVCAASHCKAAADSDYNALGRESQLAAAEIGAAAIGCVHCIHSL